MGTSVMPNIKINNLINRDDYFVVHTFKIHGEYENSKINRVFSSFDMAMSYAEEKIESYGVQEIHRTQDGFYGHSETTIFVVKVIKVQK